MSFVLSCCLMLLLVRSIYYQHNFSHILSCPLTIHALLHIADSIGHGACLVLLGLPNGMLLQVATTCDQKLLFSICVNQQICCQDCSTDTDQGGIQCVRALHPPQDSIARAYHSQFHKSNIFSTTYNKEIDLICLLLPPHGGIQPMPNLISNIAVALATCFDVPIATIRPYLNATEVEEWEKLHQNDSDAGDTMWASWCHTFHDGAQDATYFQLCVSSLLDPSHFGLPCNYIHYSMKCLLTSMHGRGIRTPHMSCRHFTVSCSTSSLSTLKQSVQDSNSKNQPQ
jgi:hypothetical protein